MAAAKARTPPLIASLIYPSVALHIMLLYIASHRRSSTHSHRFSYRYIVMRVDDTSEPLLEAQLLRFSIAADVTLGRDL